MEDDNDSDENPLIEAIERRRTTVPEILAIADADPSLVRRRRRRREGSVSGDDDDDDDDDDGRDARDLPLHAAIRRTRSSPGLVQYLLEKWPESIHETTTRGNLLPIHLACQRDTDSTFGKKKKMSIIRLLVKKWEESIRETTDDGRHALHLARPTKLLKYLVSLWPEAVQVPDNRGRLPIHTAVENLASLPSLRFLLECAPESIRTQDNDGSTALHGITCRLPIASIEYLAEKGEDALMVPDNEGYLPLHRLLSSYNLDWDAVQCLVNRAPETVRVRSNDGSLPLHIAVARVYGPIQCLVEAWPESVREETREGDLPIHVAAQTGQIQYIPFLVELWPESVRVKSSAGSLAIHLVLEHERLRCRGYNFVRRTCDTARFLIDQYPESVHETTNQGLLPLHIAARTGFSFGYQEDVDEVVLEFFRYLVGRAPASTRVASDDFLFPFNYAVRAQYAPVPVIQFLAEQWPGALRHTDSQGRTPLHVAVAHSHPPRPNVVQCLAELRPQLLETQDRDGLLPLPVAVASLPARDDVLYHSEDSHRFQNEFEKALQVVRFLAERRRPSLLEGDRNGALPLHAALARDAPCLEVVQLLVELCPESLGVPDHSGALPLHVAAESSQMWTPRNANTNSHDLVVPRPTPSLDVFQCLVEQCSRVHPTPGVGGTNAIHGCRICTVTTLNVLYFLARTLARMPSTNAVDGADFGCEDG